LVGIQTNIHNNYGFASSQYLFNFSQNQKKAKDFFFHCISINEIINDTCQFLSSMLSDSTFVLSNDQDLIFSTLKNKSGLTLSQLDSIDDVNDQIFSNERLYYLFFRNSNVNNNNNDDRIKIFFLEADVRIAYFHQKRYVFPIITNSHLWNPSNF